MAEADLTKLGLNTLDHTGGEPTPADYDYTQYWEEYGDHLATGGHDVSPFEADFSERTHLLEDVSDKWLNGRLPIFHSNGDAIQFTRRLTLFKANIGHFNTLGSYGVSDVSRVASLLLQRSFFPDAYQVEQIELADTLSAIDGEPLKDASTAFEAAQALHMIIVAGNDDKKPTDIVRHAAAIFEAVGNHPAASPLVRFQARGHKEDLEVQQANDDFRHRANQGENTTVPLKRIEAAVGAQALRLLTAMKNEKRLMAGFYFENLIPLLLRDMAVEDLRERYDSQIGTFGVRHAFSQEDGRPIQGLSPNPTFDTVIYRATDKETITTPAQLKRGQAGNEDYLPVVIFGNGVTLREMRGMAQGIAARRGLARPPQEHLEAAEKRAELQETIAGYLLAA
ncbi:MAG: hypothetical protein JWM37_198 [Candidatus Saccharibacteria bacterium]|nr:hypothetical protein [Candidatus Saccharibacteria bacterium]